MGKYTDIQNEVIKQYHIKLDEHSSCWERMHAHPRERRVCKWHQKNSIHATFDLFHEIGHIETHTARLRRCESEYYATLWAIEKCREYGLKVPDSIIEEYQDYIDMELDRGKRRGGMGYPDNLRL